MVSGIKSMEDILIVEDNPAEIRFLEEAFKDSELDPTIHSATTKREALDFVKQRGEYANASRFDVILLDWHLSKTTGQEVLEAAKAVDPQIPVVVLTGSKHELDALKSLSEADECIEKQTDPEAYIKIIRSLLAAQ